MIPDWGDSAMLSSIGVWMLVLLLTFYFIFDQQAVHYSRTGHRIFWGLVTLFALVLLAPAFNHSIVFIVCGMVLASSVENFIQDTVKLKRFSCEAMKNVTGSPVAKGTALLITDVIKSASKGKGLTIGMRQLMSFCRGHLKDHQTTVANTLSSLSNVDLNYVIKHVNCPRMFEVCGIHVQGLLALPGRRLSDLDVLSRVVLVDAFQKLGLRHRKKRQSMVAGIFLNTFGRDLSKLKCYLDDGYSSHNTRSLLFVDLQGKAQEAVLDHVELEGQKLRQECEFTRENGALLKILSDFDDTIICSGGIPKIAGCDSRLPKGTYYPGVFSLLTQLDICFKKRACQSGWLTPAADQQHQEGSNLVLLSARPRTYKGYAEDAFFHMKIIPLLKSKVLHSFPVLLMGSLDSVPRAILTHMMGKGSLPPWRTLKSSVFVSLAVRKALSFEEYVACYPEAKFVFFGDNGQGDLYFAEMANRNTKEQARLTAAFIHIVRPLTGTLSSICTQESCFLTEFKTGGVTLQKTHVGMAIQAHSMGLIDTDALRSLLLSVVEDLQTIKARHPDKISTFEQYVTDIKHDVETAMKILPADDRIDSKILKHLEL